MNLKLNRIENKYKRRLLIILLIPILVLGNAPFAIARFFREIAADVRGVW